MSGYPAESADRRGLIGDGQVLMKKPFRRQQLARVLRAELDGVLGSEARPSDG